MSDDLCWCPACGKSHRKLPFGRPPGSPLTNAERERDHNEQRYRAEQAIVARIWDQLGRPSYEELAGRSIYDLIDELKARAARAEATASALREALTQLERYAALHAMDDLITEGAAIVGWQKTKHFHGLLEAARALTATHGEQT